MLVASCSDDDDQIDKDIVGTWQLTEMSVNGASVAITGLDDVYQYQKNTIFQRYNTTTKAAPKRGGWSYEGDMLNISLDLPSAYYILNISSNKMTLKRLDFDTDGTLKETITVYDRVDDSLIP